MQYLTVVYMELLYTIFVQDIQFLTFDFFVYWHVVMCWLSLVCCI